MFAYGKGRGDLINVASFKHGVGYGKWVHIEGWSEAGIDCVRSLEELDKAVASA